MAPVINGGMGWFDKHLNRYYDPNGNRNGQLQYGGPAYKRFR